MPTGQTNISFVSTNTETMTRSSKIFMVAVLMRFSPTKKFKAETEQKFEKVIDVLIFYVYKTCEILRPLILRDGRQG